VTDGDGGHVRTPKRELLRELASVLSSESWVTTVSVFPAGRPESVHIALRSAHYPAELVSEASLDVRSYTNGDFHIVYIEDQHGSEWICRWDRHDSEEYTRDHYHAPPTARHDDGENRDYPPDLFEMLTTVVVPAIHERIGELWDTTER